MINQQPQIEPVKNKSIKKEQTQKNESLKSPIGNKSIRNKSIEKTIYVKDKNKTENITVKNKTTKNITVNGCSDTDGGYKIKIKGRCTDNLTYQYGISDFCASDTELRELFCNDENECEMMTEICSCVDGICS